MMIFWSANEIRTWVVHTHSWKPTRFDSIAWLVLDDDDDDND